jgi:lipopolysaccharide transport system ATP-binding protein
VGDAEFQKKAIGKMQDVSTNDGRTVLFVSHNMTAVSQLCTKCLFLTNGTLTAQGDTSSIIAYYLNSAKENEIYPKEGPLKHISINHKDNNVIINAKYDFGFPIELPCLGIVIKNPVGSVVFASNPQTAGINKLEFPTSNGEILAILKQPKLRSGRYSASVWFGDGTQDYVSFTDVIAFDVVNPNDIKSSFSHETVGSVYPKAEWIFS